MIGGVTRGMLPHLSGVPHLHVNRPLFKQLTFKLISIIFSPSVNSILQCNTTYLLQKEPLVGSQNRRSLNHECQATNIYYIAMHAVYMYGVD